MVAEYTGLNFRDIWDMNYIQYLTWRRDAYINWLERSQTGQEYLKNAWRMEQTKPDRARLREQLKEAPSNG